MNAPVSLEFMERVLAQCPKDSAVVIAYGRKLYELTGIKYGALVVRDADGFRFNYEEPFEIEDRNITGYWYLEREGYEQGRGLGEEISGDSDLR
jgi:hypothetical protein